MDSTGYATNNQKYNLSLVPTNQPYLPSDGLPAGTPPFKYAPPADTNTTYILLVHDYNLPPWKKDRFAETAFKRLYWQGYQGRFGLFRWPGVYDGSGRGRSITVNPTLGPLPPAC